MTALLHHLPILVVVIPLFAALLITLLGTIDKRYGWCIATAATALSFTISVSMLVTVLETGRISYWLGNWEPPWGIEYAVDYLNGFVLVVISFMAFAVSIYSGRSVQKEIQEDKINSFYALYMLLVTGLLGVVVTGDLFNLYVFLEISALAGYTLVALGKKREALVASYHYLILGTIAATFVLLGIGHLYMVTGSLNIADLRERLPDLYENRAVLTAFTFITVGLSIKLGLFPLHTWLPNAHSYCPSVMSAILAAGVLKMAAYAMIRVMFTVFTPEFSVNTIPITTLLTYIASAAIIAGSVLTMAQTEIKRMLAYSSVVGMGYIVLGISLANQTGLTGSLLHLLSHALTKGCLFLVAGAIIYKTGITHIADLRGMGKRMPFSMAAFTLAALSMIGVPLTVGFVSKWYLVIGALQAGKWFVIPVILLSALMSTVYFGRIIENIYFGEQEETQKTVTRMDEAPASMLLPTLTLAILCIVFGIFAFIPISIAELGAKMLLEG